MTTKTTGVEWKRFYHDKATWPEGAWHSDEVLVVDGEQWPCEADMVCIPDAAVVSVSGGCYYVNDNSDAACSLETHFKRWRNNQNTVCFACEAPKELADAVKEAIVAAGGKVIA